MSNFMEKFNINQQLIKISAVNPAHFEIHKMWLIIGTNDSSILELRAIWPSGIETIKPALTKVFRASDHSGVDACKAAFETEALRLNALGYNIYIVMNPIVPTFAGSAVKDQDIYYRDLLLIDIDRVEKIKEPATDEDIEAANQLAEVVMGYLALNDWPEPIRVMSGNGHHLYYVLPEVPNNEESTKYVKSLLKNLAAEFDNDTVKIDTAVFNASRITKVVGTIARKGLESDGRPYRMAVVI
jgi:hypothetical protein